MIFGEYGHITTEGTDESKFADKDFALIMEAAILENCSDTEIDEFLADGSEIRSAVDEGILLERTIVRLDKKAKLSKAQKMAVFTIAKEKKDPLMKKLLTIWRIERGLEAKLYKKYSSQALIRAKANIRNAAKSSSKLVKKVADTVQKQFNTVIKK